MEEVFDLKIENDDMVFGPDGEPEYLQGSDGITQDVKHRVRESGLAVKMVGDRGDQAKTLRQMEQVAEEDLRIEPGSMNATENKGQVELIGRTMDGVEVTV